VTARHQLSSDLTNHIRIEGIDLNGEDPFSLRNIAFLGLKLFLAIAGGSSSSIDKSDTGDNSVMQVDHLF
jgi:hypothetical protein